MQQAADPPAWSVSLQRNTSAEKKGRGDGGLCQRG